ncbi:MAG: BLUF domain-containing protein [Planctomycetaceae bacterium]|nr:BLUF domain-containing protein [Planctomycetaceae bacterium]
MLRRITYTSISSVALDQRALLDLLHSARGFNTIDKVTGILIHDRGRFFQVIEGSLRQLRILCKGWNVTDFTRISRFMRMCR